MLNCLQICLIALAVMGSVALVSHAMEKRKAKKKDKKKSKRSKRGNSKK